MKDTIVRYFNDVEVGKTYIARGKGRMPHKVIVREIDEALRTKSFIRISVLNGDRRNWEWWSVEHYSTGERMVLEMRDQGDSFSQLEFIE